MNRFVLTATLAVALGLGYSAKADAQIISSSPFPTTNGMMMTNGPVLIPSRPGMTNTFSSSLRGVMLQPSIGPNFTTPFGFNRFNGFNGFNGFNRFNGMGFNNNFFQPNMFGTPFGGFNGGFNRNMSFMGMGRGRW